MKMESWHLSLRRFVISFFVFQVFQIKGYVLQLQIDEDVRVVYFSLPSAENRTVLKSGRALFGSDLKGRSPIESTVKMVEPSNGCTDIQNSEALHGKIALVDRGACMFIEKARYIQRTGALAAIVLDNNFGFSAERTRVFVMHHGYQDDDITIPMVFLYFEEAQSLLNAYRQQPDIVVGVAADIPVSVPTTEGYTQTSDNEAVPEKEESVQNTDDAAGGETQLSPGYIALIVICVLIVITASAVSCYCFCPSAGRVMQDKMKFTLMES